MALAIGTRPELKPDPDGQTAALLYAIFLALNNSATPGETPVVTIAPVDPPLEVTKAIAHFYQSSLLSLLAAGLAMYAKDCLNVYLTGETWLAIDHNARRRRKFDALVYPAWRFWFLVKTPGVLLRTALCFLIFGLADRLVVLSPNVTCFISLLTVPAMLSYLLTPSIN